jgi:hypothetical protein
MAREARRTRIFVTVEHKTINVVGRGIPMFIRLCISHSHVTVSLRLCETSRVDLSHLSFLLEIKKSCRHLYHNVCIYENSCSFLLIFDAFWPQRPFLAFHFNISIMALLSSCCSRFFHTITITHLSPHPFTISKSTRPSIRIQPECPHSLHS